MAITKNAVRSAEGIGDHPGHPLGGRPGVGLVELASVFARYANLTFGGGSATIAVLREQIVERRGWISELDFQLAYALSRLTPGTNLLAFCTGVGWRIRRWPGAVVALLAASGPCSLLALLVTHFYEVLEHHVLFQGAVRGALAAAVAVMVNTAWVLAAPHVKASLPKAIVIAGATVILTRFLKLSAFQALLVAAVVGALWPVNEQSRR